MSERWVTIDEGWLLRIRDRGGPGYIGRNREGAPQPYKRIPSYGIPVRARVQVLVDSDE